ncbi:putative acetyltransferase [Roseovarius litorisediminis]|uniref:Putative acetyltransferase n=1 Tax=Roseovarius litorisediminis TaxID=1312363 RepID=A0A1Y5T8K8_9RHOB|nr:GNAT family N-acetyltransferase [Roseovarius litorisediminis]SLN57853.1 putative acetyltransferase [Roseovarius litorisediminis]
MAYELRIARNHDSPALIAVIDAEYARYREAGIALPPVSEGIPDDIRNNWVCVACDGDDLIGGVIVSLAGEKPWLMNLAVHPRRAGRGVGKALIHAAIGTARQAGHHELRLSTHVDMPENVALYRHLGWVFTGLDRNKVTMAFDLTNIDPHGSTP